MWTRLCLCRYFCFALTTWFHRHAHLLEQICFDALTVPSLHTNLPPAQCDTPPFFPEHGLLLASTCPGKVIATSKTAKAHSFKPNNGRRFAWRLIVTVKLNVTCPIATHSKLCSTFAWTKLMGLVVFISPSMRMSCPSSFGNLVNRVHFFSPRRSQQPSQRWTYLPSPS